MSDQDRDNSIFDPETGEYRLVRPEQSRSAYSDAYYRSAPQSGRTSYGYSPVRGYPQGDGGPRFPAQMGLRGILVLCFVCVLMSVAVGVAGMYILSPPSRTDAAEVSADSDFYARARASQDTGDMPLRTEKLSTGAPLLTAEQIYPMACRQVVGVSTSETVRNVFGQTVSSGVTGSGVILSEDGYIVTNCHVIEHPYSAGQSISVVTYGGTSYPAQVIGVESDSDLAVLKIEASGLTPAALGDSDTLTVGQSVYAVGNPLGELTYTMTGGIVSALDRRISTDENITVNMFQFDAAVNNGNSGGPVYNGYGQVVGIVTAKYAADGMEGLGFAVPISDACYIANELITRGYVPGKAYLGLYLTDVSAGAARYFGMVQGAYVNGVEEGSCAAAAGILRGDIVTAVNDAAVRDRDDMVALVRQYRAGDSARLTVYRNGTYVTVTVVFDEALPAQ